MISMKVGMKHRGLKVNVIITLTNMVLAIGQLSKTKTKVSIFRTIGPIDLVGSCRISLRLLILHFPIKPRDTIGPR